MCGNIRDFIFTSKCFHFNTTNNVKVKISVPLVLKFVIDCTRYPKYGFVISMKTEMCDFIRFLYSFIPKLKKISKKIRKFNSSVVMPSTRLQ